MNKEILTPDKAQRLGSKFIQSKYYGAQITIDQTELVTEGAFPVYHLEGSIKILSRGMIAQLLYRATAYTFRVQVNAIDGSILDYELE